MQLASAALQPPVPVGAAVMDRFPPVQAVGEHGRLPHPSFGSNVGPPSSGALGSTVRTAGFSGFGGIGGVHLAGIRGGAAGVVGPGHASVSVVSASGVADSPSAMWGAPFLAARGLASLPGPVLVDSRILPEAGGPSSSLTSAVSTGGSNGVSVKGCVQATSTLSATAALAQLASIGAGGSSWGALAPVDCGVSPVGGPGSSAAFHAAMSAALHRHLTPSASGSGTMPGGLHGSTGASGAQAVHVSAAAHTSVVGATRHVVSAGASLPADDRPLSSLSQSSEPVPSHHRARGGSSAASASLLPSPPGSSRRPPGGLPVSPIGPGSVHDGGSVGFASPRVGVAVVSSGAGLKGSRALVSMGSAIGTDGSESALRQQQSHALSQASCKSGTRPPRAGATSAPSSASALSLPQAMVSKDRSAHLRKARSRRVKPAWMDAGATGAGLGDGDEVASGDDGGGGGMHLPPIH
jgi:hypothetical protein